MVLEVVFSVTHHHILPIQFPSQHDSYAGLIEEFKANPRRESKWQNYCNTKSEQPKNPHESPPPTQKKLPSNKSPFWFLVSIHNSLHLAKRQSTFSRQPNPLETITPSHKPHISTIIHQPVHKLWDDTMLQKCSPPQCSIEEFSCDLNSPCVNIPALLYGHLMKSFLFRPLCFHEEVSQTNPIPW